MDADDADAGPRTDGGRPVDGPASGAGDPTAVARELYDLPFHRHRGPRWWR
jgi:hypothetical protein